MLRFKECVSSGQDAMKGTSKIVSKKLIALLVAGVLMVVFGAAFFPIVNIIVKQQIRKKVIISNTSELYNIWQEIPVPIYMQFYLFHVHNVNEVKDGRMPYLSQLGPYTYRERRVKYNIVWNPNGTVTYRQNRTFTFLPEMSSGKETDLVTTVNPLIATLAQGFQWFPGAIKTAISAFLAVVSGEGLFITRPVNELLWGYEDKSLTTMKKFLPDWFTSTKIGYFIGRNYTDDGLYTVATGENDVSELGRVVLYNGRSTIDIWTTEWARMLNGTDGTLGPPFAFDTKALPAFVSDLCRSIMGVYKGRASTPQDIELRRYGTDPISMANVSVNPDNIGFCTPMTKCLPSGLLNATLCQKPVNGFPVPLIFSFPHFLYADQSIVKSFYGLNPNKEEHDTYVDVEPWTGLVLQAAKRLQINMFVQKVKGIIQTANIKTTYFPIFWLNESSVTDDERANLLKDQLFTPLKIVKGIEITLLTVGCVTVVVAIFLLWRRYVRRKDRMEANMASMIERTSPDKQEEELDADLLVPNGENPGGQNGSNINPALQSDPYDTNILV